MSAAPVSFSTRRQSLQRRCFLFIRPISFLFSKIIYLLFSVAHQPKQRYVCVCVRERGTVCLPGYSRGGTVARTNHYLVVVGLERSAV